MVLISSAYSKYWCPTAKSLKDSISSGTVGYVLENGHINFISHQKAMEVARHRILKTLHSSEPFERGIIVKGSQITADVKGDYNSVNFPQDEMENAICIHGHVQSTPISIEDYFILLLGKAKEIIAINSKGEYSKLTRLEPPSWTKKIPEKFSEFLSGLQTKIRISKIEKEYKNLTKPLDENIKQETFNITNQIREIISKATPEQIPYITKCIKDFQTKGILTTKNVPDEMVEVMKEWKKLDEYEVKSKTPLVDEFWTTHDPEMLGAKYSTDYSSL